MYLRLYKPHKTGLLDGPENMVHGTHLDQCQGGTPFTVNRILSSAGPAFETGETDQTLLTFLVKISWPQKWMVSHTQVDQFCVAGYGCWNICELCTNPHSPKEAGWYKGRLVSTKVKSIQIINLPPENGYHRPIQRPWKMMKYFFWRLHNIKSTIFILKITSFVV